MSLKFCANISMLFGEMPLEARIGAARQAGFGAVEILFPYDDSAAEISRYLAQNDMPLALINCPPPNYTGGARGFAAIPGLEARFARDLTRALRYAEALGPEHVHLMAGASDAPESLATFIANLRHATAAAPAQSFTIEPINRDDMPGYFLADFDLALEIIAEVGAPNLGLQFDAYHAQKITGDALATWKKCAPHVRHIQIADAPGRHEPGSGEIDFDGLFAAIAAHGYAGWVSAEYTPSKLTETSLGWLPRG